MHQKPGTTNQLVRCAPYPPVRECQLWPQPQVSHTIYPDVYFLICMMPDDCKLSQIVSQGTRNSISLWEEGRRARLIVLERKKLAGLKLVWAAMVNWSTLLANPFLKLINSNDQHWGWNTNKGNTHVFRSLYARVYVWSQHTSTLPNSHIQGDTSGSFTFRSKIVRSYGC